MGSAAFSTQQHRQSIAHGKPFVVLAAVSALLALSSLSGANAIKLDKAPPTGTPANFTVLSYNNLFSNDSTCFQLEAQLGVFNEAAVGLGYMGWTCIVQRNPFVDAGAPSGHMVATISFWFDFPPSLFNFYRRINELKRVIWPLVISSTAAGCGAEAVYRDMIGNLIGFCTNDFTI
eukprot:CAMPEP_0202903046 /NCGR_PEP_ID=MMETSP1392-20130828/20548_1 /ASSEMBLY_ACC=CAM_ASM_000868 /TAXON_ID=225041 /ORGANISM="Chlamydomonas chlamydogama, Strain SAG 11-48b" /LENGTH=175 /DNA_ID=CAMNT_0049590005 /DNA_START=245 /DNA_END=769 /DNA_ORIENTATION=+